MSAQRFEQNGRLPSMAGLPQTGHAPPVGGRTFSWARSSLKRRPPALAITVARLFLDAFSWRLLGGFIPTPQVRTVADPSGGRCGSALPDRLSRSAGFMAP